MGARCVANRDLPPAVVMQATEKLCEHATSFNCSNLAMPERCANSTYLKADHIFSRLYMELGEGADPLVDCSFGGAALLATSRVYGSWTDAEQCLAVLDRRLSAELPGTEPAHVPAASMPASGSSNLRGSRAQP